MNLKKWLLKPYPLLERTRDKLLLCFGFALFTYIFLITYEPFDIVKIEQNKKIFLLGFGFCVFSGLFINYILLPRAFPILFRSENWVIRKEIIYVTWSFVLISLFNYSYNTFIGKDLAVYRNWFEFFGITFSVGVFPLLGSIYFIEKKRSKKNTSQAQTLSEIIRQEKTTVVTNKILSIQSEALKEEPVTMDLGDFVFATSDNNYTTVFYRKKGNLEKALLRLSITNLEQQLSSFTNIIRCHRSYLINKQRIKTIKGNARSLALQVADYEGFIPVSRSFPKEKLV